MPLWSKSSASLGSGQQSERSTERSGTYEGGGAEEEEEEEGFAPQPSVSRLPAKRALSAAESWSGFVVLEREMTAPMSLEGREAPVFGGVREKERERESCIGFFGRG